MKWRVAAAVALMLTLAAPAIWAQDPAGPPTPFAGQRMGPMPAREHGGMAWQRFLNDPAFIERVGLTKEQTDKLRALGMASAKARVRTDADQKIKRLELTELLQAEKPDRVTIDKKLREIADLHYASLKAHTDNLLAFREIVTPEQREKIRAFARERMEQRMREFRGQRPGMMAPRGPQGPGGPPTMPAPPPQPPKDF